MVSSEHSTYIGNQS
ncbi:heat-inducible transcription repressor HrcA, partial [Chlamydia psittaci 06-1683]